MMPSTPRRRSVRNTPMPIGPAPWMAAIWPDSSRQRLAVFHATDKGSINAPCIAFSEGCSRCAIERRTTVYSASPPPRRL